MLPLNGFWVRPICADAPRRQQQREQHRASDLRVEGSPQQAGSTW